MGIKGLIIEGINGAGKTSTLDVLRSGMPQIPQEAHLLLTQQYTQRLVEHLGSSTRPQDVADVLEDLLAPLETWCRRFEQSVFADHPRRSTVELTFLLETFHLNNLIEFGFDFDATFRQIDARAAAVGARMALLWIPEEDLRRRCITTTRRFRGQKWIDYQTKISRDEEELAEIYRVRQERLLAMAREGRIPFTVIDTGDQDWERIAGEAYLVWQEEPR